MNITKTTIPKRLLSLFLALTMVLGMLPAMSMTASAYSGTGTEADPYVVTTYDELRECMQSTPDYDTRYIKLGEDITNSTNVSNNALDLTSPYQTVILDLNGYTLKRAESATDWGVFTLSIGNLTIQDSSSAGTGKVVSEITGATYKNAIYVSSSGNLTIEGGTFESTESAIRTQGGTTVINGGTYRTSYVSAFFQSGTVTVNGGSFSGTNGSAISVNSDAEVTINGCTASGKIGVNGSGSIWNFIPTTSTVTVNGAVVSRTGDSISGEIIITKNVTTGSGTGTEADPYVVTTYGDLKTLMENAPTDGTTRYIKLAADLEKTQGNGWSLDLKHPYQKVVLDLNGHTITSSGASTDWGIVDLSIGSLTIRDSAGGGAIIAKHSGSQYVNALRVSSAGHLTVDGGTFTAFGNNGTAIFTQGGTTVINGGTFKSEVGWAAWFNSGTVTLNGGYYITGDQSAIYFNLAANVTLVRLTAEGRVTKGGANVDIKENLAEGSTTESSISQGQIYTDSSGLVVITGSPRISNVAITGVVAPVAGETPSNIVGGDTVLEHCSIDKYIGGEHVGENIVEWVDCNTMNPVDTFEEGKLYMVTIRLVADEGFSFSTKAAVYETLTVNGDDDAFVWKVQNDGKYAYIGYIFTCPAARTITSMGADVTGFELLNSYFDVEATPLDSSEYIIRDITWSDCHLTDDSPVITDSTMFEAGETWQLKLWFKPAAGYSVSNPDTLPVTIAGQTATYVGTDGDYYGYKIEKTFSKYLHDYIDLSMDAPVAGMTPAEYAETIKIKNNDRFPYNNFEIGMVDCYRTDWVDFDTFAEGTTYFVYVEIDLKDDTSFEFAHHDSDITALLNGTAVEDYVVVDADSTWESNFNTYGGVRLSYQVYFTAKGEAAGVTVSGTATRFGSQTDDMTIQLIAEGTSEAAYEAIVKGDAAGYSIAGVLPGTYTMKVMKQNHVTREYTVTVGSSNVVQDVEIWLKGDATGDGSVDAKDAAAISKYSAGVSSGGSPVLSETKNELALASADFSEDGIIDAKDAAAVAKYASDNAI